MLLGVHAVLLVVGLTPLGAQGQGSGDDWFLAAGEGNSAKLKVMLEEGVPVDRRGSEGQTALMVAASGGHGEAVAFLLSAGADTEARDKWGMTTLIHAAGMGQAGVIQMLLEAGADPNASGREGVGTLLAAALGGPHPVVLKTLLDAGADLDGLLVHLAHRESAIRAKVAMALATLPFEEKDAVPKLARALADKNLNVRYWVAKTLMGLGPSAVAAVPHLIEALGTHPDRSPGLEGPPRYYADVRWVAADALGAIGSPLAMPALRVALSDESADVRAAASKAIDSIEAKPTGSFDSAPLLDEPSPKSASSSGDVAVILAGPLPPHLKPSSPPVIVTKSVGWTERRKASVAYKWHAVVHNPGATAVRVVLALRLHDEAGEVLYQKEHEVAFVAPGGRVEPQGEDEVEEGRASQAHHWTLAIARFETAGSR